MTSEFLNPTGRLPSTPLGSPSMTLGMVRFTWQVVSVVLVAFGILFMALAWAPDADPKTLLLRWCAAFWLAATALACWQARRRPGSLLRFPVPLVFVVIAVLDSIHVSLDPFAIPGRG